MTLGVCYKTGLSVSSVSFVTVRMLFLITHLLFQLHGRLSSTTECKGIEFNSPFIVGLSMG